MLLYWSRTELQVGQGVGLNRRYARSCGCLPGALGGGNNQKYVIIAETRGRRAALRTKWLDNDADARV